MWIVGTVVVVGAVVGCGGDDGSDAAAGGGGSGDGITGRAFLSEGVTEGGEPRALVEGTRVRVQFHDDGRLTVQAGCNTLGGRPTVEDDRIRLDGLDMTEMGCDPALHDQDDWLADFLLAGPTYRLDGDELTLTAEGTEIRLVDREVAEPDQPLEGTVWELDGFLDGDVASSLPADQPATLTFAGGTVAVEDTGCNGGSGDVVVDAAAGEITVGPLIWTMMACGEPSATIEQAISEVLDGTVAYEVEAGNLTLRHPGGKGLTLRAR